MKKIIAFILALILILSFSSCKSESQNKEKISVGVLKGPTGMSSAMLMEQNEKGVTENGYEFTVAGAADELVARLIQGDLDIAALPTNVISTLYNKTEGEIVCLGINTLGVLYILEKGENISNIKDLEGKTILASGKGSTAEIVINYLLKENGVNTDIYWAKEHTEAATLALVEEYDAVLLPEPFVTTVLEKSAEQGVPYKKALNLAREWEALTGKELTMGGIAVRKDFAEQNPKAIKKFAEEYAFSTEYTVSNPKEASRLIEKYEIASASVAEKAIPNCNMVWITGEECKSLLGNFLSVLCNSNPQSIGNNMPGDDFYAEF